MSTTRDRQLPVVSVDLLEYLEKMHPPRCKTVKESEGHHQMYAGKVALIQWLRLKTTQRQEHEGEDEYVLQLPA